MQTLRQSRRLAALVPLALAGLVAAPQSAWAARTQEANVLPVAILSVPPDDLETPPRQVRSDLLLADDGNIYFGSFAGGNGTGAISRLTAAGELSTVYAFAGDGTEGLNVIGTLLQASDGNLYGTSFLGGDEGGGTLFRVALDGTYTLLHAFGGGEPNAILPYTGVAEGPDGLLYGTTLNGGEDNKGTIYRIGKDGSGYTVLHHFDGGNGENPEGTLIVGADGLLYGTTMMGGANNRGTIYRISTSGAHEVLYSFPSLGNFNSQGLATNATGANPRAGLMLSGIDGSFYGTAYQGGEFGHGSVFRMTPAGDVSVVHSFGGPSFGAGSPLAAVTQDAAGNLYGTTEAGGYLHRGSAWRVAPDGTFSLLHAFTGSSTDGVKPYAGILLAHGTLYTVSQYDTDSGGSGGFGSGVIVKLDLGSAGVLPVELTVTDTELLEGESITISWNAPAGSTCAKTGGNFTWPGDAAISGSEQLTPNPGTYFFGMRCTDADDGNEATPLIVRTAFVGLVVRAPPLDPVDGGGGAGSLSPWWLLLAAALLFRKINKEFRASCP